MNRRSAVALLLSLPLAACAELEALLKVPMEPRAGANGLDAGTAAAGLKQALEQGTQQAVALLGRENGYFGNPRVKIPLPQNLVQLEKTLRKFGQGQAADAFVLSLNRAAEAAAPQARAIFVDVIRGMTVKDALDIVRGPDDAATRYFRERAEGTLAKKFRPIVATATGSVGVTQDYKRLVRDASRFAPFIDVKNLDIDDYVTRKALDGLFLMVAEEEGRIRRDPAARTTELLRRVFGR